MICKQILLFINNTVHNHCVLFHINKSGDGAISQAASADDVIMATDDKEGKLAEKKKLLIKQKLGGGKFLKHSGDCILLN